MEILIGISLGLVISFMCVFFYALGAKHGNIVKSGSTVKLEPIKAITNKVKKVTEEKKTEKEQDKFFSDVSQLMSFNGERTKV